MRTQKINELIAVKLLLGEATKSVQGTGIQRAFSILHAHDALEWMLQITYAHPKVGGKKKSKMYISDYAKEIDKAIPDLIDIGNVSKLNSMRVAFKHDLIFPDPDVTKEVILWADNQINTLAQSIFQTTLSDVDLIVAIDDGQIKTKINEADSDISNGKTAEAFCNLAVAFEMVRYNLQENLEKATGKRPIFRTDFGFSSSFFLHLDAIGGDFSKAWDQLINGVEYLVDISFVSTLGVKMNDYFQFLSVTPRPMRMMNGEYHCDISEKKSKEITPSNYKNVRDFVIDAALKLQTRV
ncbi:hypothetical protein COW99_00090 [Candidatus Roizmanbacteria bacterium CG22_combo_CG10-13_8_21_14_all_38_20]|uniref:Uncharacterized protein n=1 Tax=Candidatus Roizmanbacteria bacterium CG22_combo_CG10-13_8_21_14_all_38_20 TaxID=1974862 RepID=A0A2H0BX64_9BACT|nr:hypothetical protein [Candidatus Microgenomates bacterium]PIP62194.1 MAG: hypothetical protein COW99_00090 [Candidatus Roizmanbacteria bacterium CG22_combo_CG10-13_8_21_14_all_38_20]PJC31028.1 MAG: hypothetical protein CO050_04495 [Candidatus Roizmanbacteria bacterium CG_4_9_14_0_2_um_filter_38_17]